RRAAAPLALLVAGLAAACPPAATAQAQGAPRTIADNDSVFVDGTTFTVTAGKAAAESSALIKMLGARKFQPSALVFRSGRDLYIVDAPLRITDAKGRNIYVNAERERTDRVRIEYVPPKNDDQKVVHDKLKERGALEMVQKLFSPFRLPVDLTVRTVGCDGFVNAWYEREEAGPAVTICYEYVANIMKHAPMQTTPDGVTRMDALVGQFLFVIAHEIGHALF